MEIAGTTVKQVPRKILRDSQQSSTLFWLVIALVIHVVIIGVTSIGTIRRLASGGPLHAVHEAPPAATTPAVAPEQKAAAGADAKKTENEDDKMMSERKDSKVVKGLQETAKPGEIPSAPDTSSGISLDDSLDAAK